MKMLITMDQAYAGGRLFVAIIALFSGRDGRAQDTANELRGPLDYWYWRQPLPQGNDLYSGAFGNGRYVLVGAEGAMLSSTTGTNWLYRSETRFQDLRKVVFSEGEFTAVGSGGGVFVSD